MKVVGFRNSNSACDFYRCYLPMVTAAEKGVIQYKETWAEKIISDIILSPEKFKDYMGSDIYLVQRLNTISVMKKFQNHIIDNNLNSKIVIDFDDNVFKVSPLSEHYKDYGVENFKLKLADGSEVDAWRDGVNGFDIKRNQALLDGVKSVCSKADLITVTTPILANVFREFSENVRVLPNCVNVDEWKKLPLEKNENEIRLYWGGGMSHWEDLLLLRDPLKMIFDKYKQAKIVMLGWMPAGFSEMFKDRVEYHPWSNFHAYSYKYASLGVDIALIPLVDNEFNRCKSNIKWIEASSLQIPSVVSYCSPYKEVENLSDQDLAVFIEDNKPESWVKGISMLIDNPNLRQKIGDQARMVVEQHFDINKQYNRWINAYSEVLCQSLPTLPKPH